MNRGEEEGCRDFCIRRHKSLDHCCAGTSERLSRWMR